MSYFNGKSRFKPGDLVIFDGDINAMVNTIQPTSFGCPLYDIIVMNSGQIIRASSLQLEASQLPDEFEDIPEAIAINITHENQYDDFDDENDDDLWNIEYEENKEGDEENKEEYEENKEEDVKPARFAVMSEKDIDKLADNRLSDSTKKTTNWGVNVFKG